MARVARERSSTGIYHIMLQGINRQTIFEDDQDRVSRSLTSVETQIRDILINSAKTIEQIAKLTGIDQIKLIEILSIMELEGIIEFTPGGRFIPPG